MAINITARRETCGQMTVGEAMPSMQIDRLSYEVAVRDANPRPRDANQPPFYFRSMPRKWSLSVSCNAP
ncbi:hypothetical protein [Paraburkholderia piptadeniae]|uniref:hypothetical protein n=1 Tax=Paraburkholderia piptadeniae TaxID=1701573 RepID=UPI001C443439|nr:hypothetical protein [Paraburkholderia piptadeniae]